MTFRRADPFPTRSRRVEFFDQYAEQPPEIVFARITANAAYFVAVLNQDKKRCEAFHFDKGQIRWQSTVNIHAPQGRTLTFCRFWIDWRNFAVETLAPGATGLLKHDKFGCLSSH